MNLKKIITCFYLLGILTIPSKSFSQKNRIGLQIGPIHTFFYDVPLIRSKAMSGMFPPRLRKRIRDSWSLYYSRKINDRSEIGVELTWFAADYFTEFPDITIINPQLEFQYWLTYNLNYQRNLQLNDRLAFTYGAGFNYRRGYENIVLFKGEIGLGFYETVVYSGFKRDFGINVFTGINYQLLDRLYLTAKVDFLTFVYMADKEYIRDMEVYYDSPQFPSRFDLSLHFGIGFNF